MDNQQSQKAALVFSIIVSLLLVAFVVIAFVSKKTVPVVYPNCVLEENYHEYCVSTTNAWYSLPKINEPDFSWVIVAKNISVGNNRYENAVVVTTSNSKATFKEGIILKTRNTNTEGVVDIFNKFKESAPCAKDLEIMLVGKDLPAKQIQNINNCPLIRMVLDKNPTGTMVIAQSKVSTEGTFVLRNSYGQREAVFLMPNNFKVIRQ